MKLEKHYEEKVREWAESMGGKPTKLKEDNKRGWPDQTLWLPKGQVVIAEVKRPVKNHKYEQQKRNIEALQALGHAAGFVESADDVIALWEEFYA